MRQIIPQLCLVVVALALGGCQANRPPPQHAEQPRSSGPPAMTADQMDEVQAVLQRGSGTLSLRCYQPELERRGKKFEAKAIVKILIQADGKAGAVDFAGSSISASFRACIERVIRTWEFPRLPEGAWFTYPLSFSPAY